MKPDIQRAIEILRENYIVAKSYNDSTNEDAKAICDALSLAITALEQQNKEPCEYCEDITTIWTYKTREHSHRRSNYCPVCGRRLTEV